jgi:hypothetical protein
MGQTLLAHVALLASDFGFTRANGRSMEPPRKIDALRAYMAAEEWDAALRLAASWPRLGAHELAIRRGWEACARPAFQRQLGRCPVALRDAGIAALRERYG